MSYASVISLSDAKDYLGIDDDSRDGEISRMVDAACNYVEQRTNHIFYDREKTYSLGYRDCKKVYDYPVNSVVKGIDEDGEDVTMVEGTHYEIREFDLYTEIYSVDSDVVKLVLDVGYTDVADVPFGVVEAAYMVLEHMFNQKETGSSAIPMAAEQLIRTNARHTI